MLSRPVASPPRALPTAQIASPVNYYSRHNTKMEIIQEETKLAFYPSQDDSRRHLRGLEEKGKTRSSRGELVSRAEWQVPHTSLC